MKRIVLVIATFVFVLTGCASVETNEKTASIPTGTTISIDNPQVSATQGECEADFTAPLDYESLTEPPSLTVSTLMYVDSVIASCGNYQWSHTLPDGTVVNLFLVVLTRWISKNIPYYIPLFLLELYRLQKLVKMSAQ